MNAAIVAQWKRHPMFFAKLRWTSSKWCSHFRWIPYRCVTIFHQPKTALPFSVARQIRCFIVSTGDRCKESENACWQSPPKMSFDAESCVWKDRWWYDTSHAIRLIILLDPPRHLTWYQPFRRWSFYWQTESFHDNQSMENGNYYGWSLRHACFVSKSFVAPDNIFRNFYRLASFVLCFVRMEMSRRRCE